MINRGESANTKVLLTMINSDKVNEENLTHLSRMDSSILIIQKSPFFIFGCQVDFFLH